MFIVLESIDGGGKGRQNTELVRYFKDKGFPINSKEFPDHDTSLWDDYLHPALHKERTLTSGAWFSGFAFEKFLWEEELKKFKGDTQNLFIADGYYTTTLVYQCMIQGKPSLDFGLNFAEELGIVKPDLTIYLDVSPSVAIKRKQLEEGKEEKDQFEESIKTQEQIRESFLSLAENNTWCEWEVLDGNGSIEEVRDSILNILLPKLGLE